MLLLVGSHAARVNGISIPRPVLDKDFITSKDEAMAHIRKIKPVKIAPTPDAKYIYVKSADGLMYEYELAWEDTTSAELLELVAAHPDLAPYNEDFSCHVASNDLLLTLKLSHRYKKNSPHFLKTMRDIQMLRQAGAEVPKVLKKWFKRREKETYSYKHPKLMGVKKSEFFSDDGISYVYDHDSIHEAIAIGERPAYTYYQPKDEQVGTSKAMFFAAPLATRLLGVLEEAYVLSLERSIIPFNLKDDPAKCKAAFDMALSKVCTSITSGWFREFAWENFDLVNQLYDQEYVQRFFAAVERGEVRPYVKENEDE